MKFDEFEDYWNYLDGAPVTSQTILGDNPREPSFCLPQIAIIFRHFKNKCRIQLQGWLMRRRP